MMKKYLSKFSYFIIGMSFWMLPAYSYGEVLFQDNFDGHPDWSPAQQVYPAQTACKPDGSGGGCSALLSGWSAYRIQGSPYSPVGHNTLILDGTNARGEIGKGMTYWCESGGTSMWWSDGMLTKTFDTAYDELYIGFWIKFKSGYEFPSGGNLYQQKFFRVGHLAIRDYGEYPTQKPYNEPQVIFDLVKRNTSPVLGDLAVAAAIRNHPNYYMDYSPFKVDTREMVWGGSSYSPTGRGFDPSDLGDGNWHFWEFYVKLNTSPGTRNGVFTFWHDGDQMIKYTSVAWIESGGDMRRGWNFFSIGGNVHNHFSSPGNKDEQWYAYDDVVVSTEYISPDYSIDGSYSKDGAGAQNPTIINIEIK